MADLHRELLGALSTRLAAFPDGLTPTNVPFLQVVRRSRPTPFSPGVLTPSFCLIVQGAKRVHLGQSVLDYGPGEFITALIDVPAAGHVVGASARRPYLGLRLDFSTEDIAAVVADARLSMSAPPGKATPAAFVGKADVALLDLHLRLVKLFERPHEAAFLSSLLKLELIFRLLTGEHGHLFLQRALFDPRANGVAAAIAWIRRHPTSPLSVARLAKTHGLSVSALHHKFKAVTTLSPLQYQKQLRLQEARRLMLGGLANASTAALRVGYESPSQFSREYRRQFGRPPRADAEAVRQRGDETVE
jgi:AraC-like DNA-binding protein